MTPRIELLALALLLAGACGGAEAAWLTGSVRATAGEAIFTPPSNSSPVVLRYYVPEGATVKAGDVLVRIDPGEAATQVEQLRAQIEQLHAQLAKDVAELSVKAIDAELAFADAEAALAKARVDAAVPRAHLSALQFDRYQGELERATREQALKQREFEAARAAVQRRREDAGLELGKLEADLAYREAEVATAEQRAERAGTVVHAFDNWRGDRYDEGSSAYPGNEIGEVVGEGPMGVRAYALEPDRVGLDVGQPVVLHFDAYPGRSARGHIERIAGAPEPRASWGEGRYFMIDIVIDDRELPELLSNMSVRVDTGEDAA